MTTAYPESDDVFNVPTLPEVTPLSEAGTATRNHVEHHADMGAAIEAIEANAVLIDHDHDGTADRHHGVKLRQANTHEVADTDTAQIAIHHTLGKGHNQAAAGDHVHHYAEILDRPYIICTTSTRPTNPFIGMLIYETDTNTVRVWAEFPTNPQATGVIFSDNFHRVSIISLGPLWNLFYFRIGYGILCTPFGTSAYWLEETTLSNWCRARCIDPDSQHTNSDDQEITITCGERGYDIVSTYGDTDAPCHDCYFRISDDETCYVRIGIFYNWIVIYYTTYGYQNEVVLGHLFVPVWEAGVIWSIRVVGWEFHIYRNGIFCGSIVDTDHCHRRGPLYRGWGFGHRVLGHSGGQHLPPEIIECHCQDVTSYVPTARWGLLPVASIPILIAESHATQEVLVGVDHVCHWTHILEDWLWWRWPFWPWRFMDLSVSNTDITIVESGVYHVSASLCWDPQRTFHDQSMIAVKVNGQDVRRKNWEFIRGFNYSPGFSQTNEINFWYRFNAGDKVHVIARHNATKPSWLWWDDKSPDRQTAHVELVFHSP